MSIATAITQGSTIAALHSAQRVCPANDRIGTSSALRSISCFKFDGLRYRFLQKRGSFSVVLASGDKAEAADVETSEKVLSGEWPENFSMLNYEDLTSYLEPMIFKEDAQPTALLGDVMSKTIYTARADQLLEEIDHYFANISGLPVVDKGLKCIGVLSKKDKQKASKGLKSTVGEVMTSPAITLPPEKTVLEAAATMLKNKIHRIPIVNKENEVVGIVTRTDIFVALEGLPN
eukprot:TRINITY_DN972_c0_g2_i1.p1 TRINITY_DN972_c0_g2~~TRINITY_DN972_c0_g2_i1.p1  ORF type:complete len:233 (+),score=35.42 TRINITY_DN972_c0_g2_i1:100-798(+)